MKKLLFVAGLIIAVIAADLFIPSLELEAQMTHFLKNNLAKFMHWINLGALV